MREVGGSTSKKVMVHRFDREPLGGYVSPQSGLREDGVELLSQDGVLSVVPYGEIKVVCFVKDWDGPGPALEKRLFASRPKAEGLWVRAQFRDNDFLEGLLPNDLLQDAVYGFVIVPPDAAANNQRMFLPRTALKEFRVVGVVGGGGRRKREPVAAQGRLFE